MESIMMVQAPFFYFFLLPRNYVIYVEKYFLVRNVIPHSVVLKMSSTSKGRNLKDIYLTGI